MPDTLTSRASVRQLAGQADQSGRAAIRLNTIQSRLYDVVQQFDDRQGALAEFTLIAAEFTNAECATLFEQDTASEFSIAASVDITRSSQDDSIACSIANTGANAALGRPAIDRVGREGVVVVAVPVVVPSCLNGALVVVLNLDTEAIEPFIVSLQMIAANVTMWHQQRVNQQLDWEAEATAAIVELVGEVNRYDNRKKTCLVIANRIKELLGCGQVAIGLRGRRNSRVQLTAVSAQADFDVRGEATTLLEHALNESVVRDQSAVWPPQSSHDRHTMLSHQKLVEQNQLGAIASAPLRKLDNQLVGAWLVTDLPHNQEQRIVAFLDSMGGYVAEAIDTVERLQSNPAQRISRWWRSDRKWRRLKIAGAIVAAIAFILCLPIHHRIRCECRLEPASRRFSVAPYDGVLRDALVKPGDVVQENQLLARMDDREIEWELSGLIADRERAAKKRDASLSQRDVPKAQMAQLEVERLEVKIETLRHRKANLEIRSKVAGIVIEGDLESARGAPVKIGDALFELAALDKLRLEVAVPEEELPYVQEGMTVNSALDGTDEEIEGVIERIRPQAETRNNDNVFVAEVLVENPASKLRPGMSGGGKVTGQRRMLGWILFHKAWETLSF